MKNIVLVTSGQPSANPRLLKEVFSLNAVGFTILVIYCPLSKWADQFDAKLFMDNSSITWIKVGYHPVFDFWKYTYARMRMKFYEKLFKLVGNKFDSSIRSMVLFSQELMREASKHKADLYIGHNLGALPAVVTAAQKYNAKVSFDFEDFHRGEEKKDSSHWFKVMQVEAKWVPFLDYATAASPLIQKEYEKYFQ